MEPHKVIAEKTHRCDGEHKAFIYMCVSDANWFGQSSASHYFLSLFFFPDELSKTVEASSQRHPVQVDVRGAGEQHPAGHHERDVRL